MRPMVVGFLRFRHSWQSACLTLLLHSWHSHACLFLPFAVCLSSSPQDCRGNCFDLFAPQFRRKMVWESALAVQFWRAFAGVAGFFEKNVSISFFSFFVLSFQLLGHCCALLDMYRFRWCRFGCSLHWRILWLQHSRFYRWTGASGRC